MRFDTCFVHVVDHEFAGLALRSGRTVFRSEIEYQLLDVLNRVDIVVWRGTNQRHSWCRITHIGDTLVDLPSRQLSTLAGLRTL